MEVIHEATERLTFFVLTNTIAVSVWLSNILGLNLKHYFSGSPFGKSKTNKNLIGIALFCIRENGIVASP